MAGKQSKLTIYRPSLSSSSTPIKIMEHKEDEKLIYRPTLLYVGYKDTQNARSSQFKQFINKQLDNADSKKYFDIVMVDYTEFETWIAKSITSKIKPEDIDIPEIFLCHRGEYKHWKTTSLNNSKWFTNETTKVVIGDRRLASGKSESPIFKEIDSNLTQLEFYQESQEFEHYGENNNMWLKLYQWFNDKRLQSSTTGRIMALNQLEFNGKQKKDIYVHISKLANNDIEVVSSTYANMNITRPLKSPLVISSNNNHLYSDASKRTIKANYVVSSIMKWLNPKPGYYSRLIILYNENERIELHGYSVDKSGSGSNSSSSNIEIPYKFRALPAHVYYLVDYDNSSESLPLRKHFGIFNNLCQTILNQYDSQAKNKILIYSRMLLGRRVSHSSLEMIFLDYYLKYDLSLFGMLLYKLKKYSLYYPMTFVHELLLFQQQHKSSKIGSISSASSGTPKKPAKSVPLSILTPQQPRTPIPLTPIA